MTRYRPLARGARLALAALLAATLPRLVDAQGTTGRIIGTVTEAGGTPVNGAQVGVREPTTGAVRGGSAGADGRYTVLQLPSGTYDVQVRAIGYRPVERRGVRVEIGQTLRVDLELEKGATQLDAVVVSGAAKPAIAMRQTSVETPIETKQIEALPQLSRNILALGALAPGARSYDGVAADFAVGRSRPGSATPTGAVYGDFVIDGFSWKGRSAGSSLTGNSDDTFLSMDAVQEVRFVQYGYDAQFRGGTSVAVVQTKRGTNEVHGTAFFNGYNNDLFARGAFQVGDIPEQRRMQFGGSVAGPIVKDRLFYSGAYEQQTARNPFNYAPNGPGFPAEFTRTVLFDQGWSVGSAKLTYQASPSNVFDVAGFVRRDDHLAPLSGGFTPEIAWTQDQRMNVGYAKWSYTPSTRPLSNEVIVSGQYNQWYTTGQTDNPMGIYGGGALITGPLNSLWPLRQQDNIVRLTDNFTLALKGRTGDHTVKLGGEAAQHNMTYDWNKFLNPLVVYSGGLESPPLLAQIGRGVNNRLSDGTINTDATLLSAYVQDEWVPIQRLTLNFGLRWSADLNNLLNDFTLPADLQQRLATPAAQGLVPADYRMSTSRKDDLANIAPRLRFSYDLDGKGQTVLFGGYARSYERPPSNDLINAQLNANWRIYTVLFQPVFPAAAGAIPFTADPEALRTAAANGSASPNLVLLADEIRNPYFDDFSFGVNRQLTGTVAMSANVVQKNFRRGFGTYNVNIDPPGTAPRPIAGVGDVLLADDNWSSRYRALLLTVRKSYTAGNQFQVSYTLADANTDIMRPDRRDPFTSLPAITDERHRATVSGIYGLPFGLQLSGIASVASPTPYAATNGQDLNNNAVFTDDYLNGEPNSFRPSGWKFWYRNVDARLTKRVYLRQVALDVQAEAFNLFNTANYNNYGLIANQVVNGQVQPNGTFGRPLSAYLPRRLQVGTRVVF